jgi:hypothetical protein
MHFKNDEAVLSQWVNCICKSDIEGLENLYNEQAVLIPTFSPHTAATPEKLINYFRQLATREKLRVHVHEKSLRKQSFNEHVHTLSGIYSFEFEIDQVLLSFPSRFTFVIDLSQEKPILHHHSSQVPRNLS